MEERILIGPAGGGKTTTVARLIEREASRRHKNALLVTSFTKAAALELTSKHLPINPDRVGTLHATGYRLLHKPPIAETRVKEFNEAFGYNLAPRGTHSQDDPLAASPSTDMLDQWSHYRTLMRRDDWPYPPDFPADWESWKRLEGYVDFADMIERPLREHIAPPEGTEVIYLDEFQDAGALQLALIRQWGQEMDHHMLVGDPRQVLYDWLGASPELILGTDHREECLPHSYRLPRQVKAYADQIAATLQANHGTQDFTPRDAEGSVDSLPQGWSAEALAEEACRQQGSVMVLAPCAYMLAPILRHWRDHGVPFANSYRPARGDWNPLGRTREGATPTTERALAFLGGERGAWTTAELRLWLPLVRKTGVLKRGIDIERISDEDDIWAEGPPLPRLDWLIDHARKPLQGRLDYIARVIEHNGEPALFMPPRLTVGTIHCSPGDEPVLTKRGWVPIEDLAEDDRLVSYHRSTNSVLGNGQRGGYPFQRSARDYEGDLVVIETAGSRTRVTPEHRVITRFDEDAFCERWVVYLMQKGDWWRVGLCTSAHRPYRAGGVGGRLATEQADAGWILQVCESKAEALKAEAYIQARYGLPGLTFRASKARALTDEDLEQVHTQAAPWVQERARSCLKELGLSANTPLYLRGENGWGKRNLRGWFLTEASNLGPLSGRVEMSVPVEGRKGHPMQATVHREPFSGTVYGLNVPPHHYYVSGGAIVHNSVKGGEADHVYIVTDVSRAAARESTRDALTRLAYTAVTRARESVTLCPPHTRWSLPLP